MQTALLAVPTYVVGTFFLSALIVRLAPRAQSSRQIRRQLMLFLVLPYLLVVDLVAVMGATGKLLCKLSRATFEGLSGHELYADSDGLSYFGYRRRRQNRRGSERPARSFVGATKAKAAG